MEKKTIKALGITAAALGGLGMTALAAGIGEVIWLLHKSAKNQKKLLEMQERKEDRIVEKLIKQHGVEEMLKSFDAMLSDIRDDFEMDELHPSPEVMRRKQKEEAIPECKPEDATEALRLARQELEHLTEEIRQLQDRIKLQERKIEDLMEPFQDDIQRIINDPDPVGRFMKMMTDLDEKYLADEDSVRIVRPQETEINIVYASPEFWSIEYPGLHRDSDEPAMGEVYASPPLDLFD